MTPQPSKEKPMGERMHVRCRDCGIEWDSACEPPAWLSWVDAPPEAVSGATGAASGLSDESGGGQ